MMSDVASSQTIPAAIYARVSDYKQLGWHLPSCEAHEFAARESIQPHTTEEWQIEHRLINPTCSGNSIGLGRRQVT